MDIPARRGRSWDLLDVSVSASPHFKAQREPERTENRMRKQEEELPAHSSEIDSFLPNKRHHQPSLEALRPLSHNGCEGRLEEGLAANDEADVTPGGRGTESWLRTKVDLREGGRGIDEQVQKRKDGGKRTIFLRKSFFP